MQMAYGGHSVHTGPWEVCTGQQFPLVSHAFVYRGNVDDLQINSRHTVLFYAKRSKPKKKH